MTQKMKQYGMEVTVDGQETGRLIVILGES